VLLRNTPPATALTDVQKRRVLSLIRYSYASSLDSFGIQPHDMRANFRHRAAPRRLANVVVENKDFEKLIRSNDRPVSFFIATALYATESYTKNVGEDGFTEKDHIRLRNALMGIQGKFLLSYNDDAFIRELYDAPGIQLFSTTRINNIKQRYDPNAQFAELLIGNYDLGERARHEPSQMTLFDYARHDENELEDSE
jgi:DNA adenine methylase